MTMHSLMWSLLEMKHKEGIFIGSERYELCTLGTKQSV